jgi:putative endonuclease
VKQYYVYIMSSRTRTLYIGVTNNLERRVYEHKQKLIEGFTKKYDLRKLVWFEATNDIREAIAAEKRLKGWLRVKKVTLIEEMNPGWEDRSAGWFTVNPENSGKETDSSLRSE